MPIWQGTRPYQQNTFQFSLHTLGESGQLEHTEFLDISGGDPCAPFAYALIAACAMVRLWQVFAGHTELKLKVTHLMPKRPDSLETLQLTLELLKRIRKDRSVTASELRQKLMDMDTKFTRELRTIQRLLETLSDPDFEACDVERDDSSKPYRYRWKEDAKGLSLPGLSPQESLLLTLAEQQLGSLRPARLMKSMDGFFSQARGQLSDSSSNTLEREWLDKVRVVSTSQPLLPPKIDLDVFGQVSNALYGNQWLEVDYKNAEGERKTARVMPLGLAQQGPRMYLVCRFDG